MPSIALGMFRRGLAALVVASCVAMSVMSGGAASAQTERPLPPAPSADAFESAAAGLVTGRLLYTTAANPTPRPLEFGYVTFYLLNPVSSRFEYQDSTSTFDADGDWSKAGLPAGTYIISFIQGTEEFVAREWYAGERYGESAMTVELFEGAPLNFAPITLAPRSVQFGRIAGADRFATNVALTTAAFPTGGPVNVVIVNGLGYPDALSAGPLANALGAALLMVTPTSIPAVVADELARLNPNVITIVGGTSVVSAEVEAELGTYVSNPVTQVRRIAGADRYATSRAVLEVGFEGLAVETVLLATGRNFPDALAAGPAAGHTRGAVLLVDGAAPTLDAATSALIDGLNAPTYVIGGTGSVAPGIESAATALGLSVTRVAGVDRYQTSIRVGIQFFFSADIAMVVNAFGFADALSAAPVGGLFGAPIYLSAPEWLPDTVYDELVAVLANEVIVVGGTGVLAPAVQNFTSCTGRVGPVLSF